MEQDGGAPEPQQPMSEHGDPDGSDSGPPPPTGSTDRTRRLLMAGGIIAAVGVIGAISFTVGGDGDLTSPPSDGDDLGITLPTGEAPASSSEPSTSVTETTQPRDSLAPTTDEPATTAARTTTAVPSTAAGPTTRVGPTTTVRRRATTTVPTSTTPGPGSSAPTTVAPPATVSVGSIVPDIAASRQYLGSPQQVQSTVEELLTTGGRHDVAMPGAVATLCATVELAGPIEVSGRWEHDGDEIDETGLVLRSAPGFGDCIDNGGEPLEPGSYQFLATDAEGTDSAVGNFVVDAPRIDQRFVNNGEDPVCAIFVAPTTANFYEDYVFSNPLPPGAAVVIPIADVAQDVEVWVCPGFEPREELDFDFDPTPGEPQDLIP